MARFRRKYWVTLLALVLLVLLVSLGLKALTPEAVSRAHGADETVPSWQYSNKKPEQTKMNDSPKSENDAQLEAILKRLPPPSYYVHAFYYTWYGNPKFDGKYIHWDHPQMPHWDSKVAQGYPQGKHNPPDDIGSNFYPSLGAYSSRDPSVIEAHMQQLRTAAVGEMSLQLPFKEYLSNIGSEEVYDASAKSCLEF